jgi:hypothetical protein
MRHFPLQHCAVWLVLLACAGCGKTISRTATEQLLASDAVDRAVSQIDFEELSGKKVYFDTQYIQYVKEQGYVNAPYIISSLRQQLVAARCLLQDKKEDADFIVEARVGTLGTDSTEVIYGVPANSLLTAASDVVPAAPTLPAIPELALGKKNDQLAAAKIGVFAYNRVTREPVWQAGISRARSTSKDTWLFGAGPFQSGTIHKSTRFAGSNIGLSNGDEWSEEALAEYRNEQSFLKSGGRTAAAQPKGVTYLPDGGQPGPLDRLTVPNAVTPAGFQQAAPADPPAEADKPADAGKPMKADPPAAADVKPPLATHKPPLAAAATATKFEWAVQPQP